jgi:RimJ/RimL family protein N-acetyltransferase
MHDTPPDHELLHGLPIGRQVETAPAQRPDRVRLEGRHVILDALDPARDADALFALTHGPEREAVWAYMGRGPFADEAAFRGYCEELSASADPFFYAIRDRATGTICGHAALMRIDEGNRVIEVGNIVFAPALQRTPAATEAMFLLAAYVFETLGYRRYEWKCNALNAPSRRAAERLGFTYEGTFRQHMIVKGRNRDTAWFAMLDSEWPRLKAAFEAWLAPENFDATGRQRRTLEQIRATP